MDPWTRKRSEVGTDQLKRVFQNIRTYEFKGKAIRTVCCEDQIWMVFADVCDAVGFKNARHEIKRMLPGESKKIDIGLKNTLATGINEAGLWRFASLSSKPEARAIYAWAAREQIFSDYDGR